MDEFKDRARDLNELTLYDSVMIKSTYEIINNDKFQCGVCVKKTSEAVREKVYGCTGKKKVIRKTDLFSYSICPGNFYNPASAQLLHVHRMYRKGVMSSEGGFLDQPSKYVEAMNYIETLVIEREIQALKSKGSGSGR